MLPPLLLPSCPPPVRPSDDTDATLSLLTHALEIDTMAKDKRSDDSSSRTSKKTKKPLGWYSIAALGAPEGSLITGANEKDVELGLTAEAAKVNDGVVLRVHGTKQPACGAHRRNIIREITHDDWAVLVQRKFVIGPVEAHALLAFGEGDPDGASTLGVDGQSTHHPLRSAPYTSGSDQSGSEKILRFQILQAGAWGVNESIRKIEQAWLERGEVLLFTVAELAKKLDDWQRGCSDEPGHPDAPGIWSLSTSKWKRREESSLLQDDGTPADVDCCTILGIPGDSELHSVLIEGREARLRVRVPTAGKVIQQEQIKPTLMEMIGNPEAWQRLCSPDWAKLDTFFKINDHALVSAGPLKSALQKVVRVRAEHVALGFPTNPRDAPTELVRAEMFVASCFLLLATAKGNSYLPDLHLTVPGHVAALKRAAIVMVEDAHPSGGAQVIQAVAMLALVASRGHVCPPRGLACVARHLTSCFSSGHVFAFRTPEYPAAPGKEQPADQLAAKIASDCVHELRSFPGDLEMFRKYASHAVAVPTNYGEARTTVVPFYHLADQHVYSGMGHMLWSMHIDADDASFKRRLQRQIFNEVTGWNPRYRDGPLPDSVVTKEVRAAQWLLMRAVLPVPRVSLGEPAGAVQFVVQIDPGVMAGAAGPQSVTVKTTEDEDRTDDVGLTNGTTWKLQVVLGIANAEEKVILEPLARGTLEDTRGGPSPSAVRKAIKEVRTKWVRLKSDLVGSWAKYHDGAWHVGGKPWVYANGGGGNTVTVEMRSLPPLNRQARQALEDDLLMGDALAAEDVPMGVCGDAEPVIREICGVLGAQLSLRMLGMLRGVVGVFRMPVPTKSGGISVGQPAAYAGDWKIFRALLLVSRLVPGAFRPKVPPVFEVRSQALLQFVVSAITAAVRSLGTDARGPQPRFVERARAQLPRDAAEAKVIAHAAELKRQVFTPAGIFEPPLMKGFVPYEFQAQLVQQMRTRDTTALIQTPSHFLVLPTGSGKTVVALWYFLRYALENQVDRLVWLTVGGTVDTHMTDLGKYLAGRPLTIQKYVRDERVTGDVVLIAHENLQNVSWTESLVDQLIAGADRTLLVVDEVHRLFGSTAKGSHALRIADACQRSLLTTAIPPVFSPAHPLSAEWLRRSIAFPTRSETVAIAALNSAAVEEPYTKSNEYRAVEISAAQRAQMLALVRGSDKNSWNTIAAQARGFAQPELVRTVVAEAKRDRDLPGHADGGVFVVAADAAEANALVDEINQHLPPGEWAARRPPNGSDLASNTYDADGRYAVLVETVSRSEGYSLHRLGVTVQHVLASSPATRVQIRGRIARMALQTRTEIQYIMVYAKGTILEFLLKRHATLDAKVESANGLASLVVDFQRSVEP